MSEKVSIIIPVYNAEKTIEKCITSLLEGDYQNIEIIAVNDCSFDGSLQICDKFCKADSRVKVISNPQNSGVSETRNIGLSNATGKYLMFVDSDDWVEKGFVSELVNALESTSVKMAISGFVNHDEVGTGETTYFGTDFSEIKIQSFAECAFELLENRMLQQLWNKIFITRYIKDSAIQFDKSINIGEDFRFILDYIQCALVDKVTCIPNASYHYMRINENSLMNSVGSQKIEESLVNLRKLYHILEFDEADIELKIQSEKKKQINGYAYLIMHNAGMSMKDKKKHILALDEVEGKRLYRECLRIWRKERVKRLIKG